MANPLETAFRLQAEGRFDDAEALCLSVLKSSPKVAPAHYILGVIHHRQGDNARAERSFTKAAKLNPEDPGAQSGLAMVAREKGRFGEAEIRARKALSLAPRDPNLMNGLAIALRDLNRLPEAIVLWQAVLKSAPQHLEGMLNLGSGLEALGRSREAEAVLRSAMKHAPDSVDTAMALANQLVKAGALESALDIVSSALAASPDHALLLELCAFIQIALGNKEEANALAWRAVTAESTRFGALNQILEGSNDPAEIVVRPEAQRAVQAAKDISADPAPTLGPAAVMEAGRLLDMVDDCRAAVACFQVANGLLKAQLTARNEKYDPKVMDRYGAALENRLETGAFCGDAPEGQRDPGMMPAPIFVVGMPRSATSLVERIIGSHSACIAMGELGALQDIAVSLGSAHFAAPDIAWTDAFRGADVAALRQIYENHAQDRGYPADKCLIPIDKNPLNLTYAPLALALWPRSKVIWCQRCPADVAFSIYSRNFVRSLRFDTDLADIRHFGGVYERIGRAVLQAFPDRVVAVSHEALVADPVAVITDLLAALDLAFEPACLAPHKSRGGVASASKAQVQRPINAAGIGRSTRYEGLLVLPDPRWV